MLFDWRYDDYSSSLWLPIEFGITPANEETSIKLKEIEDKLSDSEWDNINWMTRIMVEVVPDGHDSVIDGGKVVVETRESDLSLFSNRRDAIRFKNLLVDAIEGKNTFGQNQWYPKGISSAFEKFFENERKYTQQRINDGKELLYSAQWYEPGYNDDTKEVPLNWFTTKKGYSKEDIKKIENLKVGETWYSDDHDVTAIKCDDIEKLLLVKESDVTKIANSIRKMSVNKLYRN